MRVCVGCRGCGVENGVRLLPFHAAEFDDCSAAVVWKRCVCDSEKGTSW